MVYSYHPLKARAHEKETRLFSVRIVGRLAGETSVVRYQDWVEAESLNDPHDNQMQNTPE